MLGCAEVRATEGQGGGPDGKHNAVRHNPGRRPHRPRRNRCRNLCMRDMHEGHAYVRSLIYVLHATCGPPRRQPPTQSLEAAAYLEAA